MKVEGTFETKFTPGAPYSEADGISIGPMTIAKVFHGPLSGTSTVHMIGVRNAAMPGSGVYVAIERVTAELAGKRGTFVLHHTGVMNRGASTLDCLVVPDSGTGELAGLRGRIEIRQADKAHHYAFDYEL